MSTVRRPAAHRAYIREVSKQTRILQLQGFLFFGTIAHVEDKLRGIVNNPNWRRDPVRFVIVDLTLVAGVDMSSAEAFVRVQRLLASKGVLLVFCGVSSKSPVGKALASSGILEEPQVERCETLNDAMECKWGLQYTMNLRELMDVQGQRMRIFVLGSGCRRQRARLSVRVSLALDYSITISLFDPSRTAGVGYQSPRHPSRHSKRSSFAKRRRTNNRWW